MGIALMLALVACGDNKTSLSGDAPVEAKDFVAAFPEIKLPTTFYDTSLQRIGDTTTISRAVLTQFIPDSALQETIAGGKLILKPVARIERDDETYLLVKSFENKKASLSVFVLNKDNKFAGAKQLISSDNNDDYTHSVSINKEPTFSVSREKITKENQLIYTRTGYAYNKDAGFMVVVNDGNENTKRQDSIINPIDTFARKNPMSGDYIKDKKNFISLRDGRSPNIYRFFVHFEKSSNACVGELKGELTMKDAKTAQYTANGDPCVINFTFSGNQIQMKEEGSCGNHRDIKCFFDDTYTKKKEPKPKTRKK